MKRDIFNGKIKKEYFLYILISMILVVVLFVGVGVLCICASIWGATRNPLGERILIAAFGVISFILGPIYLFLELLVIRQFPKYEKLRRTLFNSDCYFTDNVSTEYRGRRRHKAAFDLVTALAEQNKKAKNVKYPIKYKVYNALIYLMFFLEFGTIAAIGFFVENKAALPLLLQNDMTIALIGIGVMLICVGLMIFSYCRAYAIREEMIQGWQYPLHTALIGIAVRENSKKHKFWYDTAQVEEIGELLQGITEYAELKLERKGDKFISFTVIDTLNNHVVFEGFFI